MRTGYPRFSVWSRPFKSRWGCHGSTNSRRIAPGATQAQCKSVPRGLLSPRGFRVLGLGLGASVIGLRLRSSFSEEGPFEYEA